VSLFVTSNATRAKGGSANGMGAKKGFLPRGGSARACRRTYILNPRLKCYHGPSESFRRRQVGPSLLLRDIKREPCHRWVCQWDWREIGLLGASGGAGAVGHGDERTGGGESRGEARANPASTEHLNTKR
jgi:hypothetical protein